MADGMNGAKDLRGAPLMIVELDGDLAVTGWNERAEKVLATPRGVALGRSLDDLLPVEDSATWRTRLAHSGDAPLRLIVRHPSGGRCHLEAWVQQTSIVEEQPSAFMIYAHDITHRVADEQRLALQRAVLDAVIQNLDLAVWAIDRDGVFLRMAGKALATAGLKEDQLVGLSIFETYPKTYLEVVRRALAGSVQHSPPTEEHGLTWETWYVPVDDPGLDAAVVCVSLDITEARRREKDLQEKLQLIERQQETIRELSTPIIEVWDGVLTLPIVGLIDSVRTAELMNNLLESITRTRARFAILDLTGVEVVDTSTASHLIGLVSAIRLLGADGVLTGIHPNIAQTIVSIGVDLSRVRVFAKLRDALKYCISQMPSLR